jgi:hypothetical protein
MTARASADQRHGEGEGHMSPYTLEDLTRWVGEAIGFLVILGLIVGLGYGLRRWLTRASEEP